MRQAILFSVGLIALLALAGALGTAEAMRADPPGHETAPGRLSPPGHASPPGHVSRPGHVSPPGHVGEPAIVIKKDGLCGMPGSDADGNLIFGGIGRVETVVENGNRVMLSCKGMELTNLSGRGQHYSGFPCGIVLPSGGLALASDSQATVAASGMGSLTCWYVKP